MTQQQPLTYQAGIWGRQSRPGQQENSRATLASPRGIKPGALQADYFAAWSNRYTLMGWKGLPRRVANPIRLSRSAMAW